MHSFLQDACSLESLGDKHRANNLTAEIKQRKEQRRRDDRKLAKEVAKWVQSALELSQSHKEDAMIIEDV